MSFIESIKNQAKSQKMKIVLPESQEIRNLEAASVALKESLADIVLIGKKEEIIKAAGDFSVEKAEFIDPENCPDMPAFINELVELRKSKGMTPEDAAVALKNPMNFGAMLVRTGKVDGMVSGAIHSTADVLRAALQIVKTAPGTKTVSTFMVMDVPNCSYGENGMLIFSDCGLVPNPNSEELSDIAISSADTFKTFIGKDAKVAMLSFSTRGSASHADVDKVTEAVKIAKEKRPDLLIDGEMQLDAAIVEKVAKQKAPDSKVAGQANVLIFPDLDAGNIGYKLVQRFANGEAYGPITQGIAKPVNDLSRGCSATDIVGVIAITSVQAQNNKK